jgi:hypothetical protein
VESSPTGSVFVAVVGESMNLYTDSSCTRTIGIPQATKYFIAFDGDDDSECLEELEEIIRVLLDTIVTGVQEGE